MHMNKRLLLMVCIVISAISAFSCSDTSYELLDVERFYELTRYEEDNITTCIFFTDPHINKQGNQFDRYLKALEDSYYSVPLEFCICGGDWLNNNDTIEQACDKLRFIDGYTYRVFNEHYYPVLGNHDTNYQGRKDDYSDPNTGTLSHETIVDLMFNRQGNSYYSFDGERARFFIFDTGIDWFPQMDDFKWEQIHWFARELQANKFNNNVIVMHIYTIDENTPTIFAGWIMDVIDAYNHKRVISLDEIDYDFSSSEGTVSCALCGHCHTDFIDRTYSIPVVGTTHLKWGDIPTYDLCIFNWEKKVLNLIRVGAGSDRVVQL